MSNAKSNPSATSAPSSPAAASASPSTEVGEVQPLGTRPPRYRRRIFASGVIAAFAAIALLGTLAIRDDESSRSEVPASSPQAARSGDLTPAELNEMWASADAGFIGVEPPAAAVQEPAESTPETDAALWASIDAATLVPGR